MVDERGMLNSNRGIALLITLSFITVVVAAAMELNRRVRSSVMSAGTTRDRITLSHLASSGVHAAMAMLVEDRMQSATDTVQEDWADPGKIAETLLEIPFEEGAVDVTITDELGKIQLNALAKFPGARTFNNAQYQLWDRFLHLALTQDESLQEIEPSMIINSVKDWLDSGDDDAITGLNGAESDYYEDLYPPYQCKNGPFTHVSELLLVRGVTADLFVTFGGTQGISSFLTAQGMENTDGNTFTYAGKINISTAELPVLAAMMPPGYEELAPYISEYRIEKSGSEYMHDLSSPTWFRDVPGASDIDIDPNLITASSDVFRILAVAVLDDVETTTTVIVQREKAPKSGKWRCRILSWQEG
jgi:general secretion pathway protein K